MLVIAAYHIQNQ